MKLNSTRVQGKNFRNLCGKPLFKWILDTLLLEGQIDKIVINTDARSKLAENGLYESDRIIIRDRPKILCGDHISMNLILENDIENIDASTYLMTHTTNPLLSLNSIRRGIDTYNKSLVDGYDSLFSVNKFQTRFYNINNEPINHDPNNLIPTQELEPWFEENSNLYIFSKSSFRSSNARIGKNPKMLVTDKHESIDIDTPSDWEIAEIMVNYYLIKGLIK
jgi:CMP-N-acetylneuraminic acid synthetase